MKRLFLDQGLPRSASSTLSNAGWDVVHAADVGMSRATDVAILEFARAEARTCVTLDADFHALLAIHAMSSPSVVRIRIEGLSGSELAKLLQRIWPRIESDLVSGAAVTVTDNRIRLRRLPIAPSLGREPVQ